MSEGVAPIVNEKKLPQAFVDGEGILRLADNTIAPAGSYFVLGVGEKTVVAAEMKGAAASATQPYLLPINTAGHPQMQNTSATAPISVAKPDTDQVVTAEQLLVMLADPKTMYQRQVYLLPNGESRVGFIAINGDRRALVDNNLDAVPEAQFMDIEGNRIFVSNVSKAATVEVEGLIATTTNTHAVFDTATTTVALAHGAETHARDAMTVNATDAVSPNYIVTSPQTTAPAAAPVNYTVGGPPVAAPSINNPGAGGHVQYVTGRPPVPGRVPGTP